MLNDVFITSNHILTYRAIRSYIYLHKKAPDFSTVQSFSDFKDAEEVLSVLEDLRSMGYLSFDDPHLSAIHLSS